MWAIDLRMDLGRKMRFVHVWTHTHIHTHISFPYYLGGEALECSSRRLGYMFRSLSNWWGNGIFRATYMRSYLLHIFSSTRGCCIDKGLSAFVLDYQHLSLSQFASFLHATISINVRVLNFYMCKYLCKRENKHNSNLILRYSECFQAYTNYTMQLRVR